MGQKLAIVFIGLGILGSVSLVAVKNYASVDSKKSVSPTSTVTPTSEPTPTQTPTNTPTPTKSKTQPTKTPTISCTGPDGKVFQATQKDCDNLNAFWKENTPQVNHNSPSESNSNTSSSNNNPNPTPTNSPINPTTTATPSPIPTSSDPFTVSTNNVTLTVSRSSVTGYYALIYGTGFTLKENAGIGNTFCLYYNEPTNGQGFDIASGGIQPNGSINIRAYINSGKPNGTYTGSVTIRSGNNCAYANGPVVSYSITLTD